MKQAGNPCSAWHTLLLACATFIILGLAACSGTMQTAPTEGQTAVDLELLLSLPAQDISYQSQVRPVLGRRCVVCHGCYDAPCQLKLSSPEGIERGANKNKVYDGARILAAEPTRLFIDAKSTEQWRKKNFHTVLNEGTQEPRQNLENSVMYHMLRLKQRHPQPRVGMLPDNLELGLNRKQTCATLAEFDDFARQHPDWGMPYGMPNLDDAEYRTLVQWLAQGAPMDPPASADDPARQRIEQMKLFYRRHGDTYFNQQNWRRALTYYERYHVIDPDSLEIKRKITICRDKLSELSAASEKPSLAQKTPDEMRDQVKRLLEESGTESTWIMQYLFEEQSGEKDSETPW